MSDQLTFLSAEPPVSRSPSQESASDWTIRAATSRLNFWRWLNEFGPPGLFGRMSPESCRTTKDERWEPSSGSWGNAGSGGPTECWTLNIAEWAVSDELCHSAAAVCSLSDILEPPTSIPPRFYLSAKACAGILRRAVKRGKDLPDMLALALVSVFLTEWMRRVGREPKALEAAMLVVEGRWSDCASLPEPLSRVALTYQPKKKDEDE